MTALKQVETSPKVEGRSPLKTQHNGDWTTIKVFFGQIQNTPTGGLSGTRFDPVSFRHLYNCTSLEQRAPSDGPVVSIGQRQ